MLAFMLSVRKNYVSFISFLLNRGGALLFSVEEGGAGLCIVEEERSSLISYSETEEPFTFSILK